MSELTQSIDLTEDVEFYITGNHLTRQPRFKYLMYFSCVTPSNLELLKKGVGTFRKMVNKDEDILEWMYRILSVEHRVVPIGSPLEHRVADLVEFVLAEKLTNRPDLVVDIVSIYGLSQKDSSDQEEIMKLYHLIESLDLTQEFPYNGGSIPLFKKLMLTKYLNRYILMILKKKLEDYQDIINETEDILEWIARTHFLEEDDILTLANLVEWILQEGLSERSILVKQIALDYRDPDNYSDERDIDDQEGLVKLNHLAQSI